jgi:hypothetical protein
MDIATLTQLEKDLAGEGGEALRTLFGEKVGCVKAWEKAILRPNYRKDVAPDFDTKKHFVFLTI